MQKCIICHLRQYFFLKLTRYAVITKERGSADLLINIGCDFATAINVRCNFATLLIEAAYSFGKYI